MRKRIFIRQVALSLGLCLFCVAVASQPLFTSVSRVADVSLTLNGRGVREVSAFNVDVYKAALYLKTMSSDEREILLSDSPKKLSMVYLRGIDGEDIREAWDQSLSDNCVPPLQRCEQLDGMRKTFLALLDDVRAGERWDFEFSSDGVRILKGGSEIARLADVDFSRLLLATWIGTKPPTEDLKRSLLGRK